ncbi:MAG TPA: MFS transporter, partial [Dehalococcoidia bacterium]|nr:MFS transporter [Dehalococcoidia bacterium]
MDDTLSRRAQLMALAGLLLGMLVAALDQTVVGTAMPKVIASLGGMTLYSWVFTTYMLSSTSMVPVFGKLSDMYGRRRFFILGIAVFMVGSWLSGAAQTMEQLIIFRGLQGLGAGAIMPIAIAGIAD